MRVLCLILALLSSSHLRADATAITGSLTATGQVLSLNVANNNSWGVQITGTWTGSLVVEGSINQATSSSTGWTAFAVFTDPGATSSTAITANGVYYGTLPGKTKVRLRASSIASGSASATLTVVDGGAGVPLNVFSSSSSSSSASNVTVLSSALPTGAATESTLASAASTLTSLDAKDFATQTTLSALNSKVTAVDTGNVSLANIGTYSNADLNGGPAFWDTASAGAGLKTAALSFGSYYFSGTPRAYPLSLSLFSDDTLSTGTGVLLETKSGLLAWKSGIGDWARVTYGQATKANSLPVTLASDDDVATQTTLAALNAKIGTIGDGSGGGAPSLYSSGLSFTPVQAVLNTTLGNGSATVPLQGVQGAGTFSSVASGPYGLLTAGQLYLKTGTTAGGPVSFGQQTMANSVPVAIASNQSAFNVGISHTVAVSNAGGNLSISTGVLTTAGNVSLNAGTAIIGALSANQSVNVAQMNGVATSMGNGVAGTGVQRVVIASDNTSNTNPFLVNQSQVNGVALSTGNGVAGTGVQRMTIASDNTPFQIGVSHTVAVNGTVSVNGGSGAYLGVTCVSGCSSTTAYQGVSIMAGAGGISVTVASLPLPSGAATSANQTTMITAMQGLTIAGGVGGVSVTAAQQGTWNVGLSAGSNLVGVVDLDSGTNFIGSIGVSSTVGGVSTTAAQLGSWYVNISSPAIATASLVGTGQCLTITTAGFVGAYIQVVASASAFFVVESSSDLNTWTVIPTWKTGSSTGNVPSFSGTSLSSLSANDMIYALSGGAPWVRLRCISYTSGSSTFQGTATMAGIPTTAIATGTNVIGAVGVTSSAAINLSGPAAATASFTAVNQGLTLTADGFSGALFAVVAGCTCTFAADYSLDGGTNWIQTPFWYGAAGATPALVTTQANPATGASIQVNGYGASRVRLRVSAYTSGTATIHGASTNYNAPQTTLVTASNLSSNVAQINGVTPLMGNGTTGTGSLRVTLASDTTSNTNPLLTQAAFPTSGQALSVTSPAITTGVTFGGVVKASAAVLMRATIIGTSASNTLHFYNQTTVPATGATTNHIGRCALGAAGQSVCDFGPQGIAFATGLVYTVTGAIPDADGTSTTSAVAVTLVYK